MPARKKTAPAKKTKANPVNSLVANMPALGITSKFITKPVGKGKRRVDSIDVDAECREELVWDVRGIFDSKTTLYGNTSNSWRGTASSIGDISLDHKELKQADVTSLCVIYSQGDDFFYEQSLCERTGCLDSFIQTIDAVAGPVGVLLNNDRYIGDWWTTEPSAVIKHSEERNWYGVDNFFLRHPILTSLTLGIFRQAVLLYSQKFDEGILKMAPRKEVEDCLTNADPVLALRIMNKLKPWLAHPSSNAFYPFSARHWDRLRKLHKAIYKYGYDELFDGDIHNSWGVRANGESYDRQALSNGPIQYFGGAVGVSLTKAGERLNRLGK